MPWNIRRDFHIDINAAYGSFLLVSATDSSLRQPPPDMIAGDSMPVRFHFWERGIAGALTAADPGPDTVFIFSGRPAGAPSGSDLLFITDDFTEIETGVWEGALDLQTAEFAAHLLTETTNGAKLILGELEVRDGVANTKRNSFQFDLTARREVYQAEDVTPTPLPSPIGNTPPVNAAQASTTIIFDNNPSAADEFVLELPPLIETFTFVTGAPSAPFEVQVGFDKYETINYLLAAIAADSALVSAELVIEGPGDPYQANLYSLTFGTAGNDIVMTLPTAIYNSGGFIGGVDATLAPPWIRAADGFLFIQEAGFWKKATLTDL